MCEMKARDWLTEINSPINNTNVNRSKYYLSLMENDVRENFYRTLDFYIFKSSEYKKTYDLYMPLLSMHSKCLTMIRPNVRYA